MDRILFRPVADTTTAHPPCWNCGRPVTSDIVSSYLYRRAERAIVDSWRRCECGAYQNDQRVHEIAILRGRAG